MPASIDNILEALCYAMENIVPDVRPDVLFKRWMGSARVETAPIELRERAFQFLLGRTSTPRTISSQTQQWQRIELLLVVGYNLSEPRQKDSNSFNVGTHTLPFIDQRQIYKTLVIGNVFENVSGVKRLVFLGADSVGPTSRTYRFDLEYSESF